jgi:hypothetical protein
MNKLALSFGTPKHGWLDVGLRCGETTRHLDASDVPADSITMLASGLLQLVKGYVTEVSVTWFLEPREETWTFRRTDEVIMLDAQASFEDSVRVAQGSSVEVCLPIWRALRRLQSDMSCQSAEHTWSHPFPSKEVEALGIALGRRSSSE